MSIVFCGALELFATSSAAGPTAASPRNEATNPPAAPAAGYDARRLEFLQAEIARHDRLYHQSATPEITDAEYDELKREMVGLETRALEISTDSSTQSVEHHSSTDDRLPGFATASHGERMLSLDKIYSEGELHQFHERLMRRLGHDHLTYVIEPKFDGLAVNAIFEGGKLVRLLTRGDGDSGDDVTGSARIIRNLPVEMHPKHGDNDVPARIELRGEVYIAIAEFERLNREREERGELSYTSPRNLAAGSLKAVFSNEDSDRSLEVVFYGTGEVEPATFRPSTQHELLQRIDDWGLPTVHDFQIAPSIGDVWNAIRQIGAARTSYPFPTDGAVVKLDLVSDQRILGVTERAPRWAAAFKFAPERTTTRLRAITLQVGRTGLITPVAELEPVLLAGAVISRASLHNAEEISRRDICVGDWVVLERAGEVIPNIIGVDLSRRSASAAAYVFPVICPSCGERLVQNTGKRARRCTNFSCRAQLKRRLQHFASPACLGIHGLGESMIETLVDSGRLKSVSDLYRLDRTDLENAGRAQTADALLEAIDRSRQVDLWRVLFGLGIPGIGAAGSKTLADQFHDLTSLANATVEDYLRLDGIGEETAEGMQEFLHSPQCVSVMAELSTLGVGRYRK